MISKLYFIFFAFSLSLLGIEKVLAQTVRPNNTGGTVRPSGVIDNPLGGVENISTLITKILEIVVQIGLPVIALAIVYTGFLFVSARGNDTKLTEAKKTLFWTVIGAAVILGAFVIQITIEGTIKSLK